jgi:hypothetical protein
LVHLAQLPECFAANRGERPHLGADASPVRGGTNAFDLQPRIGVTVVVIEQVFSGPPSPAQRSVHAARKKQFLINSFAAHQVEPSMWVKRMDFTNGNRIMLSRLKDFRFRADILEADGRMTYPLQSIVRGESEDGKVVAVEWAEIEFDVDYTFLGFHQRKSQWFETVKQSNGDCVWLPFAGPRFEPPAPHQ